MSNFIYTPLTKKALAICFDAHKEQKDKSGLPYIFHPFHLAEQMETEYEICVALLHDVIEDSSYTFEMLKIAGFPNEVLDAIALLTHKDSDSYIDYVEKIKQSPLATKVKLADLEHNSTITRLDEVTSKDRIRIEKYHNAIDRLRK